MPSLLLGACIWIAHPAAQDPGPEYRLKAAFVSKFPEFTEWPESALSNRKTLDLCVARPNPFGSSLSDLVVGETVRGRPLVARDVADARAIDTCQLLFVPRLPARARKALLARAATRPILTVGDYPGFLDEGGIVNLRLVDGQVRFEINVAAANRAGVRLSSQLLRLALNVRGGPS
ncbi:MAG: YfiR family protein [Vicinamibacterales bacterium]